MVTKRILANDAKSLRELSAAVSREILEQISSGVTARPLRKDGVMALNPSAVWVVDTGEAWLEALDKPVQRLQAGDIIGPWAFGLGPIRLYGEAPSSQILAYDREAVEAVLQRDIELLKIWTAFVSTAAAAHFSAFAQLKSQSVPPLPRYRSFGQGEVILKEGEFSREVLSLVEGGAEVFVHGEKVGEIQRDEIFGALAALTGQARCATVVASRPSVCKVFVRDDFEDLLRSHSSLMAKLMEDIARAVDGLNEKVVDSKRAAPLLAR